MLCLGISLPPELAKILLKSRNMQDWDEWEYGVEEAIAKPLTNFLTREKVHQAGQLVSVSAVLALRIPQRKSAICLVVFIRSMPSSEEFSLIWSRVAESMVFVVILFYYEKSECDMASSSTYLLRDRVRPVSGTDIGRASPRLLVHSTGIVPISSRC